MSAATASQARYIAKRVTTGVNVSATHPTLGPLFWCFISNSDCNAPDHYGITDSAQDESTMTFKQGWREGDHAWMHRGHMGRVLNDEDQISTSFNEYGEPDPDVEHEHDPHGNAIMITTLHGCLSRYQERSGQTVDEFVDWLRKAAWIDVPAPSRAMYLQDVNEFCGFHPVWTSEISEAITFTAGEVAEGKESNDCCVIYAAGAASFVPQPVSV